MLRRALSRLNCLLGHTDCPPILNRARISTPLKARLTLENCEDRMVPTTVTVQAIADATEGGSAGVFRFTRSDTAGAATVAVAYSGTAAAGSDYSTADTPGTITFSSRQTTFDLTIPATDDGDSEPTETVTATIQAGSNYTVGTPGDATLNILDNDAQVVTVATQSNTIEGGSGGSFLFTRTGDLSSSLTVNYTVGGTATSSTDYTSIGTSVTFAANAATATATVVAATDAIYDPDESVVVTLGTGTGYSVGSPSVATVTISDDTDTVQTLVHSQTFQLTGSGNVNVTLTVTYNAPGAPGLYTWSYAVSNPSSNTTSLTSFVVPVDGMDADVTNLTGPSGWTGSVGSSAVSWTNSTGIAPGTSATFTFTTLPREVGGGTIEAGGGGSFLADLPTAPAPREKGPTAPKVAQVNVGFNPGNQNYTFQLDMTTADGSSLTTGAIPVLAANAVTARDALLTFLKNNDWAVVPAGDSGLTILGKVQADKAITMVKTLGYKTTNKVTDGPFCTPAGPVTVVELP